MDELFPAEDGGGGGAGQPDPGPVFAAQGEGETSGEQGAGGTCLNCKQILEGTYCHHCGQRVQDLDVRFSHLMSDWFGGVFGFDARIWRTLKVLFRSPGQLTLEFWSGRRVRYVSPLRLYLVSSLLMLFSLSWTGSSLVKVGDGSLEVAPSAEDSGAEDSGSEALTIGGPGLRLNFDMEPEEEPETGASSDPGPDAESVPMDGSESPGTPPDIEEPEAEPGEVEKLFSKIEDGLREDQKGFERSMVDNLPQALTALVPLFALLLKLFYRRGGHRYLYHLILSLHIHSTAFLAITVGMIVDRILGYQDEGPVGSVMVLALVVHTFMVLRTVYGQGRRKTGLKLILLMMIHSIFIALSLLAVVLFVAWRLGS